MTMAPADREARHEGSDPAELLIKEARQKARWRRLRIGVALSVTLILVVALVLLTVGGTPSNSKRSTGNEPARASGPNTSSVVVPHFDGPVAIAVSDGDVWVVNDAGNSITEFNARTGSQVRIIGAKADAFHHPDGIAEQGSHVWVTNGNKQFVMGTGNYPLAKYSSVTELNASNGSLVRVIDAKDDGFLQPGPVAVSGGHVWVLNSNSAQSETSPPMNALIELNASTGSLVHIFTTNVDGLYTPFNLTASRFDVWVSNVGGPVRSVTEINSDNGSLERIIKSTKGQLGDPYSMAASGGHVWVTNLHDDEHTSHSIAELEASNGSFVRVIKSAADKFSGFFGIAAAGSHVWVTNDGRFDNSVTELNAGNGSLVRVIKAKADGFNEPTSVVASGSKLWVLNANSVTELNANNGSLVRVVK